MVLPDDILKEAHALIEEDRVACLWFLRPDFLPEDSDALSRAMTYIERRGNLESYIKARRIREWLSQHPNKTSAKDYEL